jgi:hypothetical protein
MNSRHSHARVAKSAYADWEGSANKRPTTKYNAPGLADGRPGAVGRAVTGAKSFHTISSPSLPSRETGFCKEQSLPSPEPEISREPSPPSPGPEISTEPSLPSPGSKVSARWSSPSPLAAPSPKKLNGSVSAQAVLTGLCMPRQVAAGSAAARGCRAEKARMREGIAITRSSMANNCCTCKRLSQSESIRRYNFGTPLPLGDIGCD